MAPHIARGKGRRELLIMAALLALALAVRLYDLTGESLWYDEAFSVWIGEMSIASLKTLWQWKVQFPSYYLLIYYWMRWFGQGEFSVRLLGALAGAWAVVPVYLLGKSLFSQRVGRLAALLLIVNPLHVWYSQEVRMHSWAVLLAALSLYAFWRLLDRGHWVWWVLHVLLTALTFHMHYYVGFLILAENLYLLIRLWREKGELFSQEVWRELRWWVVDQVILAILLLPGVIVFLTNLLELREWNWLAQSYGAPGLSDLVNLLNAFSLGVNFPGPSVLTWLGLATYALLLLWGIGGYRLGQIRQPSAPGRPGALLLVVMALCVPVALVFVVGQFAAIWVTRYLLPFLPFFLILVALGLDRLPQTALRGLALSLLLIVNLYGLYNMYTVQQKEDWRGLSADLAARIREQDLVVLMDEEIRVPLSYYFGSGGRRVEVSRFADGEDLDRAVAEIERRQRGGHLWIVVSHADGSELLQRMDVVPALTRVSDTEYVGITLHKYVWS